VEKPNEFLSETVNGGIYLFSSTIFDEIKAAMDNKVKTLADDPAEPNDDQLRLEQDVIAPLCHAKKIYVFQSTSPWVQIKSAASAIPANALFLASYKTTNPSLLRRRSPTIIAESRAAVAAKSSSRKGPEIVEPCFIDETAVVDPSAKIGPNVSVGAGTKIGFGARVKDSILLNNVTIEANAVVSFAILSEDCQVGQWSRVEGSPVKPDAPSDKNTISILAKDVHVQREVCVRSVIVLPNKIISRSAANDVLL